MTRDHAYRRHHRARLRRKRAHYHGRGRPSPWSSSATPAFLGRMVKTPTPCSCWMCGSPRRAFKSPRWRLTVQELRALAA